MWIKRIDLRNFQCHSTLSFEFSPRVNAITGESDHGKSAVIRALRWLCFNKPDGHGMRKAGTDQTMVSATLDNGKIITRIRSVVNNRYIIEAPGEEPVVFDNFGTAVPQPVKDALGIDVSKFSESIEFELPIAGQFDAPFLLGETGITRSVVLGALSKTGLLDNAAKWLGGEIRQRGKLLSMLQDSIESGNTELTKFDTLAAEADQLERLDHEVKALIFLKTRVDFGERIQGALTRLDANIAEREFRLRRLAELPDTGILEGMTLGLGRMDLIDGRLAVLDKSIASAESASAKIEALTPELVAGLDRVAKDRSTAELFFTKTQEWKRRFTGDTADHDAVCRELKSAIEGMLEKIKEEGKCPTCLRDLDPDTLQRIQTDLEVE